MSARPWGKTWSSKGKATQEVDGKGDSWGEGTPLEAGDEGGTLATGVGEASGGLRGALVYLLHHHPKTCAIPSLVNVPLQMKRNIVIGWLCPDMPTRELVEATHLGRMHTHTNRTDIRKGREVKQTERGTIKLVCCHYKEMWLKDKHSTVFRGSSYFGVVWEAVCNVRRLCSWQWLTPPNLIKLIL